MKCQNFHKISGKLLPSLPLGFWPSVTLEKQAPKYCGITTGYNKNLKLLHHTKVSSQALLISDFITSCLNVFKPQSPDLYHKE